MAGKLRHETLTEAHDLFIRLALGVEVRPALAPSHRQRRQRILEHLLETEELQNAEIHARMEAQAALVGADRAAELHPESAVDLHALLIVNPRHPEHDHPLRFDDALQNTGFGILLVPLQNRLQRLQHLGHRLQEFRLPGIASLYGFHRLVNCAHDWVLSAGFPRIDPHGRCGGG